MNNYKSSKIGDIYDTLRNGRCEIIEKLGGNQLYVTVRFVDTGYITSVQFHSLLSGNVRDKLKPSRFGVGYEGVGNYKFTEDGKLTRCAIQWKSMLERCYCEKFQDRFPAYVGCTVCEDWHNYQNFAKWYYDNYPNDGKLYELDKDLKIDGNKLYSPSTCTFLTPFENRKISKQKKWKFISPNKELVEFTNLTQFCKDNNLVRENMGKVWRGERQHCSGWTKYEED